MAVATPVLERNADTEEKEYTREYRDDYMSDEYAHNSRISENYARLINPESKPRDIIPEQKIVEKKPVEFNIAPVETPAPVREVIVQKPYLVENARADADIFRADSLVNRKLVETVEMTVAQADDEENEDLRPTQTTIQYKTSGVKKTSEEGRIATKPAAQTKRFALTKKDKIIIAIAFSVIVALFVLIIVNSVVISNLTNDVSALQTTLTEAETTYTEVLAEKTEFLDNIEQIVGDFAAENGLPR